MTHPNQSASLGRTGESRAAVCSSQNHPQWPLPGEQAGCSPDVPGLEGDGGSCHREEMMCCSTGGSERREFVTCPSPWPASGAVEHRFVSADRVASMSHTLHWKFYLMSFEEKYFKRFYVFLYPGKKFEPTSFPCGECFLFSSCQNTRVIWVFLSSFPDACLELMGLNRSNLLCWHFPLQLHKESAFADTLSSPSLKELLFLR